jgi:hypothetical protein
MASVFKRGRWVDAAGRKCAKDAPGAKWVESRFYTVQIVIDGKPKLIKGYSDTGASLQLAAELDRSKAGLNHLKKRRAPHLRPSRLSDIPQSVREASRLNTSQFHFGASHGSCGYQSGSVHVFCCF